MARIIKFRAWDGKKMFEPSSISWKNGVLWICDTHGDNKLEYELIAPNSQLMQYCGILDKNGKEIYEGDIVEFHAFTFNGSETEYDGKGIVKYRNDGMCFVIEEKNDFDWMVRDTSNFGEACFEIIGNIYENPELLEPNKN